MARLTGRFGTLSVGGNAIADLFNWTLDFDVEALPCAIKGEASNPVAIGGIDVRITAERFVDNAGGSTLAKLAVDHFTLTTPGTSGATVSAIPGAAVEYILDQDPTTGSGGARITGSGVVTRGSLTAPRGLANDRFEVVGTTVPVVTAPTS